MKRNLMKFATVVAMTAGMALAQQAPANPQPPANAPAHRPWARMRQRTMQALNLSDAQKQQAKTIFEETRKTTEPVRAQLRQNRQAMAEAVKADNSAEIRKLARTEGDLRGRLIAARGEARARFYNILTPEQRAKVEKLHTAMRRRIEQRRAAMQSKG
jgi:Spy/CpxP family protein refolding chaperone